MKTSCIEHPANHPMIIIRRWQREFCEGNTAAAALMSFFEYWHNIKLEMQVKAIHLNRVAEQHGDDSLQDATLWQHHTAEELAEGIQVLGQRDAIRKALQFLQERGVIEVGDNPNPRYRFDRTRYYLFHPEVVNGWLAAHYPTAINRRSSDDLSQIEIEGSYSAVANVEKPSLHVRKIADGDAENRQAITEISSKTSSETSAEKGNDGPGPSAPSGAPLLAEEEVPEEAIPEWQNFLEELSEICHGHKDLEALTGKEIGALRAEGSKIRKLGFEVADLRQWFRQVWWADWRWKKDQQRPGPAMVRSSLPRIDVDSEAARRSEYSAYNNLNPGLSGASI